VPSSDSLSGLASNGQSVPLFVGRLGGQFLLFYSDATAALFDPRNNMEASTASLETSGSGADTLLSSLTDWVLSGDEIIGYGAGVEKVAGQSDPASPVLGFVGARILHDPLRVDNPKLIRKFPAQRYYLLGHHYLAANNLGAFFVTMDDSVGLYWYMPENGRVTDLSALIPEEYRKAAQLKATARNSRETGKLFAEVESGSIVVGLYGKGNFLYLLTRKPDTNSKNGTLWHLYKLDPVGRKTIDNVLLPTRAHHLTIVPAEEDWYIFEKGPVEMGSQRIDSLIDIPASWIENPQISQLNEKKNATVSCRANKASARVSELIQVGHLKGHSDGREGL
jgi:hypothetical protein